MAVKIMIDAGHGGFDNGGVYYNRLEKDDNLRLALAIGKLLTDAGINVSYTRTADEFFSTADRIEQANRENPDFFISIHRNTSPYPNTYDGTQILIFNNEPIKSNMCANIQIQLQQVGYDNLGCEVRSDYEILRGTRMPALMLQIGFLNSDSDNELFDKYFNQIAEAIVRGILMSIQQNQGNHGNPPAPKPEKKYVIQMGLFNNRQNAENLQRQLEEEGITTYIYQKGSYLGVFSQEFDTFEEAEAYEENLNQLGYATLILQI